MALAPLAQAQIPAPNGIAFTGDADALAAGTAGNVSVQLLYNGMTLKSEGIRIYLMANDTSIIPAGMGTFALTDSAGIASFTFTPGMAGGVKLTATAMSTSSGVTAEKVFLVAGSPSATPAPSVTVEPSATPSPSAEPTETPTATATATATPTPTPEPGAGAQATGIVITAIVLAILILIAAAVAQRLRKK